MHKHAPAIDRLGRARIKAHFRISDQAITYWRNNGVPRMHHKTLIMLGVIHGVSVTEIAE